MGKRAQQQNKKKFAALRSLLRKNDYTTQELADYLQKSRPSISQRLNGKQPWDMDDVYKIADWLYIPYSEIHIYFPKEGDAA